jgi:hypothetical protein
MRILFIVLLLFSFKLFGQESDTTQNWNYGYVIFQSGDSINAFLSYEPFKAGQILRVKEGDQISFHNPKVVESFSYYDRSLGGERKFFSHSFEKNNHTFLEELFSDERFLLICYQKLNLKVTRHTTSIGGMRGTVYTTAKIKEIDNTYFVVGDFKLLTLRKRNLIGLMIDKETQIKSFIKQNYLALDEVDDYIKVINEYQRLNGKF